MIVCLTRERDMSRILSEVTRAAFLSLLALPAPAAGAFPRLPDLWYIAQSGLLMTPGRDAPAPGDGAFNLADRFEHDTIAILKRISRRPIDPLPDSELLADLGFDSLQVLELVGELEDRFGIAIPLNDLTHIRTVRQVVDEIRGLTARQEPASS